MNTNQIIEYMKFDQSDLRTCIGLSDFECQRHIAIEYRVRIALFFVWAMQVYGIIDLFIQENKRSFIIICGSSAMIGVLQTLMAEYVPLMTSLTMMSHNSVLGSALYIEDVSEQEACLISFRKHFSQNQWNTLLQRYYSTDEICIDGGLAKTIKCLMGKKFV
jgi:hypothetical protein